MQKRFWEMMTQKHYELLFIQEHSRISITVKRCFEYFTAIASSTVIGTWAIVKENDIIWAIILGLFQVLTLLRPVLPFDKRVEQLDKLSIAWTEQYTEIEKCWHPIASGQIDEDAINQMIYDFEIKWNATKSIYLQYDFLNSNEKLEKKVQKENAKHFRDLAHV